MNIDALVDRLAAAVVERLKPAPKEKPPRPAADTRDPWISPARELTELEKIQRHFEFLREHPECGFGPRRW